MTAAVATLTVTLVTGDGESREARMYPLGDYACPFCSAAVSSPMSWDENEANNEAYHAASGEAYERLEYPACMWRAWEFNGCPNPMCLVSLSDTACAKVRAERAARQAEADERKRRAEAFRDYMAETKARQNAACDAAREKCSAEGYRFACWRHSTSSGLSDYRVKWTRHRNADSCPQMRTRYGI